MIKKFKILLYLKDNKFLAYSEIVGNEGLIIQRSIFVPRNNKIIKTNEPSSLIRPFKYFGRGPFDELMYKEMQ